MAFGQPQYLDDGFYPEIYTKGLDFVNTKSKISQTRFKVSYWKWMLKLVISPVQQSAEANDDERIITAIDQQKAAILLNELEAFEKGVGNQPSYGIRYNKNMIFVTNNNPDKKVCLVIRKFKDDACTQYDKEQIYEFNTSHFAVRDCDDKTGKAQSVPYADLEFKLLKIILNEYIKAFTGAQVGSLAYYGRDAIYDRANNNLASIANKLQVKIPNFPYPKGDLAKLQNNNKPVFGSNKKSISEANDLIDSCLEE